MNRLLPSMGLARLTRTALVLIITVPMFSFSLLAQSQPSNEAKDRWIETLKMVEEGLEKRQARERSRAIELLSEAARVKRQLLATHPDYAPWQSDFCLALDHLGDAVLMHVTLRSDNRHELAIVHYREALLIREGLLSASPDDSVALKGVAASHQKIGIALAYGKAMEGEIKHHYEKSLNLVVRLASLYPSSTEYQQLLIDAHMKLVELDRDRGNFSEAIVRNKHVLRIKEQLARAKPNDRTAQLAVVNSYAKMAQDSLRLSDKPAAQESYQTALRIAEKLASLFADDRWLAQRVLHLRGQIIALESGRQFRFAWPEPSTARVQQKTRTNAFSAEASYRVKLSGASVANAKAPLILSVDQVAVRTVDGVAVDAASPRSVAVRAWEARLKAPGVWAEKDGSIADFVDPMQVLNWMKAYHEQTSPELLAQFMKVESEMKEIAKETGVATLNPMTSWFIARTTKQFWEAGVAYWTGAEKYPVGSPYGKYTSWTNGTQQMLLYFEFINHGEASPGSSEMRLSMTFDINNPTVTETLEWARAKLAKGDETGTSILKLLTGPTTPTFIQMEAVVTPSTLMPSFASQTIKYRSAEGQQDTDGDFVRNEFFV
ncbi:MAG: hypothetical protein AB8C46_04910 [Burkholderiaceae bacterium]